MHTVHYTHPCTVGNIIMWYSMHGNQTNERNFFIASVKNDVIFLPFAKVHNIGREWLLYSYIERNVAIFEILHLYCWEQLEHANETNYFFQANTILVT